MDRSKIELKKHRNLDEWGWASGLAMSMGMFLTERHCQDEKNMRAI
jgi:hypothetical protein